MFDHLHQTLVVLRLFRGLSQAEVADRAGIRCNQVSRYETGQVLPQLRQLRRLLEALDVDLPTFVLALDHVNRLQHLLDQETTPAHQLAVHSVAKWWASVDEQQQDLSQGVARWLEDRLTEEPHSDNGHRRPVPRAFPAGLTRKGDDVASHAS